MSKRHMSTAKELAFKAYCLDSKVDIEDLKGRFECWWSDNYGNHDRTVFIHEHNVYVDGKRYIKAE